MDSTRDARSQVLGVQELRTAPSAHLLPVRVGDWEGRAGKAFAPAAVRSRTRLPRTNPYREDVTVEQSQDARAISALKAIIQTMMPEFYLLQSGGLPRENFLEALRTDDAIAMAISNEFTESEIEEAFGWPKKANEGSEAELRATPVTRFLNAEQLGKLRLQAATIDRNDEAGEEGLPGCE